MSPAVIQVAEIQWRRNTAAGWETDNPLLAEGEPGYETDARRWKLGDGATLWNDLAYQQGGSVASVNGVAPDGSGDIALTADDVGADAAGAAAAVQSNLDAEIARAEEAEASISGGSGVSSVTAADASAVIGGTASAPTIETGTLDEIANLHPPAAAWSNNSQEITSVADPTTPQSAATKNYVDGHIGGGSGGLAPSVLLNALQFGPLGSSAQDGHYTKSAGGTQTLGDGSGTTLASVYTTLAAAQAVYPFATALAQTVDFCAVQAALNYGVTLTNPRGTTVFVPKGDYIMGDPNTSRLVIPTPSGSGSWQTALVGANRTRGYADYGAVTRLKWTADMAAGSAPHTYFAIDATAPNHAAVCDITLLGPSIFSFNSGRLPCSLAGLRLGGSSYCHNVSMAQFSTCVGYGGGTAYGFPTTTGFDHSTLSRLWTNNCGYGVHLLPGSNTAGDQRFYDLQIAANCTAIAIAGSASSGLTGSNFSGGGAYGSIGIYIYDDDSHAGGAQVLGCEFENFSFEKSHNAAIYGQRRSSPGGSVVAKNVFAYFPQTPNASLSGWASPTFTVSAVPAGATGNQVTITDNNGIEWALGMTVSGPTGVQAGTTVTAINGNTTRAAIMAGWPYNNPTLTLSKNLTADPTGTALTIIQPQLAAIVARTIRDNFAPTASSGGDFPAYYVPAGGTCENNVSLDVLENLNAAKVLPLVSGPVQGVTWGQPGGTCFIGSGQMSASASCSAGDLLMRDTGAATLVKCDGSRPPVGAAILSTVAGGNVDFYKLASYPTFAPLNNYGSSSIPAGSLLKADSANPGGVAVASGPNDGWVVGVNNSQLIPIAITPPAAPTMTASGSGSTITPHAYPAVITYVTATGESAPSASSSVSPTTGQDIIISSPAASGGVTGWYAYVLHLGGPEGDYTRQQAAGSPTPIGTDFTLTTNPTGTGALPPDNLADSFRVQG